MQYENPEIPEGINVSNEHPLKELLLLSSGIVLLIAIVMALLIFLIEYTAPFIPFEYEQHLVSSVIEHTSEKVHPKQHYLQKLADKIVLTQNLPQDMQITVHYIDKNTVNAFATLGGHLIIYRGLVEKLSSENALTMLLAHEIAHIKYRHPIKSLGSGLLLQIFWAMISDSSSSSDIINITQLTSLTYSRRNETLADEAGLYSVFQIYNDVNGATDLFQTLIESQQDTYFAPPEYLSTHPDLKKRITYLKDLADKNGWPAHKPLTAVPLHQIKG